MFKHLFSKLVKRQKFICSTSHKPSLGSCDFPEKVWVGQFNPFVVYWIQSFVTNNLIFKNFILIVFNRETKKLDVLANILYINSNGDDENEDENENVDKDEDWLNILTNNTSICLKDKENGAKLTLSISGNTEY